MDVFLPTTLGFDRSCIYFPSLKIGFTFMRGNCFTEAFDSFKKCFQITFRLYVRLFRSYIYVYIVFISAQLALGQSIISICIG